MQKKKRIIIIDDDKAIIEALIMMLQDGGYDAFSLANGLSIPQLLDASFHLVLLDVRMSGIDGKEICRALKKKDITKKIPIIMISANHDLQTIAKESGADDFIAKPFEMDELLTKIAKYTA